MIVLVKPVGLSAKKGNQASDVTKVKKLLNGIPEILGGPRVKLKMSNKADSALDAAIRQFQKQWLGESLADGLVNPISVTLNLLNLHSAENLRVVLMGAENATQVAAVGDQNVLHFVAPKRGMHITLTAHIMPDHAISRSSIVWEGAKPTSDPLVAKVPAFPARKQVVRIKKTDGTVLQEVRVWVVWCTISAKMADTQDIVPTITTKRLTLATSVLFVHKIYPPGIVFEANRPNLEGRSNTFVSPPGETDINGNPLSEGATSTWDSSRQIKIKMIDPDRLEKLRERHAYPTDDIEGNDDSNNDDEFNDPYAVDKVELSVRGKPLLIKMRGRLFGEDQPGFTMYHSVGKVKSTIERRLHFREFTRIELGGKWHRISDFLLWRFHARMKRVDGKWQDDNSIVAFDNQGFDAP